MSSEVFITSQAIACEPGGKLTSTAQARHRGRLAHDGALIAQGATRDSLPLSDRSQAIPPELIHQSSLERRQQRHDAGEVNPLGNVNHRVFVGGPMPTPKPRTRRSSPRRVRPPNLRRFRHSRQTPETSPPATQNRPADAGRSRTPIELVSQTRNDLGGRLCLGPLKECWNSALDRRCRTTR